MKLTRLFCLISALFCTEYAHAQSNYKIVYNVFEDRKNDNYDIYSMNMDGTGKKNITNTPGVEWVYYANNNKVFYLSDIDTCRRCYFLYEMDAEGNNKRKVSNLQLEDSWMGANGGSDMVVTGRIGKNIRQQFFIIDLFTGAYKQITNDTVSYKNDPIFTPGGNEIIFRYRPDKKLRKTVPAELWIMNRDGSNKRQLTHYPQSDTTAEWFDYHAGPPQWNSKYGFISYLSKQSGQTNIYAVSLRNPQPKQITSGVLSSGFHSWSSNGKWLAMDKSTNDGKNFDIYLMNYKKKKEIQLTNSDKSEMSPVIVEINK